MYLFQLRPSGNNDFHAVLKEAEASMSFNFKPAIHAACPAHPFIYDLDPENPDTREFIPVAVSDKLGKQPQTFNFSFSNCQ